ncbi:unnamed protein product [Calicophoron daubneyi]|uniref:Uncharacterized protein n=1 Tax=Calicophoron daubneyi TaxID=300641 RepID=A0AAV2T6A4_CALDB
MWNFLRQFWFAVSGPTLYRIPDSRLGQSTEYHASILESAPSVLIRCTNSFYLFLKWSILFWAPWLYKSIRVPGHLLVYTKYLGCVSAVYLVAHVLRGTGRYLNPEYHRFLILYRKAKHEKSEDILEKLTLYTFDSTWPEHFDVRSLPGAARRRKKHPPSRPSGVPSIFWPLTWLAAQTVGVRITYPGCTGIINSLTFEPRMIARDRLRQQYGIRRVGIRTRAGDFVESFYVDRRGSAADPNVKGHGDSKGEILVLCCEGNGGYPEIGISCIPLDQGYSVLAWNHPGFGCSTALPLPDKEQNAVEAVLLFAVHYLHFQLEQICLFAWSIGGYTATWAAMNYPEIGGVILDATFDNIDELTRKMCPQFLYPLTLAAVRSHLDLNNLGQLIAYDGPVRIIRRSSDEIITTDEPPTRLSNRGNNLLVGLLKYRFPHLVSTENEARLWDFLSLNSREQGEFVEQMDHLCDSIGPMVLRQLKNEALARQTEADNIRVPPVSVPTIGLFPSALGSQVTDPEIKWSMLMYLVIKNFSECPGEHCTPLVHTYFQLPWSPFMEDRCPESIWSGFGNVSEPSE